MKKHITRIFAALTAAFAALIAVPAAVSESKAPVAVQAGIVATDFGDSEKLADAELVRQNGFIPMLFPRRPRARITCCSARIRRRRIALSTGIKYIIFPNTAGKICVRLKRFFSL